MNELGAQVDRDGPTGFADGVDAAAESGPRLHEHKRYAGPVELARRGQPGHTATDDEDLAVACYHVGVRVWVFALCLTACKVPAPATLEMVPAPAGDDVAALVRAEVGRAQADGRKLLVYVGAKWCEPCNRFHAAAQSGDLTGALGHLRLLAFDIDRDNARLTRAGYVSRLIPLFALPGPDGRASGRQVEGSVKGDAAVANISPRLQALIQAN